MMTEISPLLILTRRRTGGTSLTAFLSRISPLPTVQHEPFNLTRVWGETSRRFAETGDEAALRAEIAGLLDQPKNIKHCFEMVPQAQNRVLIDLCVERGYRVLLLTRQNEIDRQVSLALALATGAWGTRQAAEIYPAILSGERKLPPLPQKRVMEQARRDGFALLHVLCHLRVQNIAFDWLLFEEIYRSTEALQQAGRRIAESLGIALAEDDPQIAALAAGRGQNSRRIEDFVPNATELRLALARVCPA